MSEATRCPRRDEGFGAASEFKFENKPDDGTCDYCGSLLPDVFMARLEAGDVELGTTSKNYKVYVHNAGGESFRQSSRTDGSRATKPDGSPDQSTWSWQTRSIEQTKFYFQHLSAEQRQRFVELLNAKRIRFYGGFGFSALPFFVVRGPDDYT